MSSSARFAAITAVCLLLACLASSNAAAAGKPVGGPMTIGHSYQNDVSLPLYYLPAWPGGSGEEGREGPENPRVPFHHVDSPDPVIQHLMAPVTLMPSPILNFDGIGFPGVDCNCAPPDTNGEVGTTQYVQMVNTGFQVFDKTTGASVLGPQSITSVWSGFGGVCETAGAGDPVVLFDQLANRWLISQFAGTSIPTDECIAISVTDDATGSWYRYAFHLGSNFFDYPHLGVWPDGYYMSMNIFNSSGTAYLGPQPFVFDRDAMLNGDPATFITPGVLGASRAPILPADLDGSDLPPLGAPNTFVETPNSDYLLYHFHTDFVTPGNSTFTLFDTLPGAGYTELCPGNRNCVPQTGSGGTSLDGIGDRVLFRLAYRNFGDHESLVGNFSVDSGPAAGIRWFELRDVSSGPATVHQESTYAPDSDWRWMGSIAMDSAGNMALGFSASSASIHPQLRYTGRLSGDPLNTMSQGEVHLFDGPGSQTGGLNRWGDYSAMTIDPVDDCTFWYTNEYLPSNGSFNWKTRIGNFKFDACGTPGFTLSPNPPAVSVCAGDPAAFAINVGSISGFNSPVTLSASGNPPPTTAGFAPNPVPSLPGSSTLTIGNTGGVSAGSYPIQIDGTASGASNKTTNVTLSVFTSAPPAATLVAPADGALNQLLRPTFSWTGSGSETYTIDVATDPAFNNIVYTDTVTGTSATPNVDLASNTQYFWRVTSANACGTGSASATFDFTTAPLPGDCSAGTTPNEVYNYGFESGLGGWTLGAGSIGNTWADSATAHSGAHAYHANDTGAVSDQRFVSPAIALPASQVPVTLQFWHQRDMENNGASACYDGGILEVSSDGGATWTQVQDPDLLTDPYTGPVNSGFSNPLAGLDAWCGIQAYTRSIVDISSYGGQTVQFRYRLGSDSSVGRDGWYLDDVRVQSCAPGGGNTHTVTPSVGTPSGTIAPSTPQTVNDGATTQFTLAADTGFHIDNVGGTCGGTLNGSTFTTDPVTSDCTVIANFAADGGTCPGGDTFCSFEQAPIPDNGYDGTLGSMACTDIDASSLPAGSTVTNITMTTGITHTWAGDLTAKLVSPDGSILGVFSRPGLAETADDGSGCCGDGSDLVSTSPLTFDDAAPNDAELMGSTTSGVICQDDGICDFFPDPGAVAVPPSNFAGFIGETAPGTWELCVGDSGGGDTGTLDNWTITIGHTGGGGTPVADIDPASFAFDVAAGAGDSDTLHIGNIGSGTLDWSIVEAPATPVSGNPLSAMERASLRADQGSRQVSTAPEAAPVPNPMPGMVVIDEGFDDITTLPGAGWLQVNNSNPLGSTGWFQGNDTVFPAFDGATTAYIGANFNNTAGTGTISNWLVTPPITFSSGASASFYTRTATGSAFPDRLEVRLCTGDPCTNVGTSETDVGDFTTVLLDINPTYAVGGYPDAWTQFVINGGLPTSGSGRIAFRYFVEGGGPSGANSNYIGIDRVTIDNGTGGGGGCSAPSDVPWLSVSPTSGSVVGGNVDDVTVSVDSTGLAPGSYTAHMCVATNDPGNALVDVPVSLTVTGGTITHTVTPSVGTPSGTITPDTPQTVNDGDTIQFTLTPDAGFQIGNVGGTCGGTLAGNVFTTNPVTADCTVIANFANDTIFEDGFDGP